MRGWRSTMRGFSWVRVAEVTVAVLIAYAIIWIVAFIVAQL